MSSISVNSITDLNGDDFVPVGGLVQEVSTVTGAVATGTTTLPFDDTIPQNTEGTEFMTKAITPKNANNLLKITVTFMAALNAGTHLSVALFQDSGADALAAMANAVAASGDSQNIVFTFYKTAGTTSSTTFKVRAGGNSASTITFNGSGGARRFGGLAASSIVIQEIKV